MQILRLGTLLTGLMLSPAMANAQGSPGPVSLGLFGAVDLSTMSGTSGTTSASLVGFGFGGFMRVHLNDSWDFEPELSYAGKGAKSTFTVVTPGFTVTSTARENYVEVPLLLKVFTGPPSAVRAYAEGGPALAFLASCSVSESAPGVSQGCNTQVSTFNSFDTGILVGAGLELPMGSTAILLGARYNLGLLNATTDGSSLKNRNLQFLTGIRF